MLSKFYCVIIILHWEIVLFSILKLYTEKKYYIYTFIMKRKYFI